MSTDNDFDYIVPPTGLNIFCRLFMKHFISLYITKYIPISYALSFCRSKMILDLPDFFGQITNCFGPAQFIFVRLKSFCSGPNYKNQSRKIWFKPDLNDLDQVKMICWIDPTKIICTPIQNNLDGPKSFWTYRRTRHQCTGKIDYMWVELGVFTVHKVQIL